MVRHSLLLLCLSTALTAQTEPRLDTLEWRSIGPAATGGRIADIAVVRQPDKPDEIYVGTASGGVFKSINAGVSFTPVFDRVNGMMSIGAVAVAPSNPSIVWVGTGEANNRQSSSWGDGVYKSADGGANWEKMGLDETRHVGRIVIHPKDPNTVYVAATGHLWGSNPERGVYKTIDGGKSWQRVLYKDEHTGAIDLAMDPENPEIVFAAMYQRQRKGWGFNGGGPGSGIFRTTDGGATWTELTNGLPHADKGRIGLSIFPGDTRVIYAIVEADPPAGRGGAAGRGQAEPRLGGVFRSKDRGESWEHMSDLTPRPSYYGRIYADPKDANRVYLLGSNRGFYISEDGGRTFGDLFSGVHSEDHALWVDPENSNHLVIGGDGGVSISFDRGMSWLFRLNLPIGQFYNISTNNADPFLVCGGLQDNGSWCTPSASGLTYGISFKEAFNIGSGDGMHARFAGDDRTVLVSSQNGAMGRLDLPSMQRQAITPPTADTRGQGARSGYRWYWTAPLAVSHFSSDRIYTGANVLFRSDDRGVSWKEISPDLTANVDREKLEMMGGPVPPRALSRNDGQPNFSALTAIAESPLDGDVLYTGADDGTIQATRDGGQHWKNLTGHLPGVPAMLNISSIEASKFSAGRVYLTVDGHFADDYHPYIYVSEDFGETWHAIASGLPETSVHRIREHPSNPDVLVAGLEMGVYISFDRGAHWRSLNLNMPPAPVYDLAFQESAGALVVGTHGRSIWVLDRAEPLGQMTPGILSSGGHLFPIAPVRQKVLYSGQFWFGAGEYFAPNPPQGAVLTYYLPKPVTQGVSIAIEDSGGNTVRTLRGSGEAGLNRMCWDLRMDAPLSVRQPGMGTCRGDGRVAGAGPVVLPGKYKASIGPLPAQEVTVLPDPNFPVSDADRKSRHEAIMSAYSLQQQLTPARTAAQTAGQQIAAMRPYFPSTNGTNHLSALVGKAAEELSKAQQELNGALVAAAAIQYAMDAYAGRPTAAQLRQLDRAWEDAASAVAALNRVLQENMPAVHAAAAGKLMLQEVRPVAAPVRK